MAWPQDAQVGQKVVCILMANNADIICSCGEPIPRIGTQYTISWVGMRGGVVAIDLKELPGRETQMAFDGYQAMAFRPVQTKSTEAEVAKLRKLLNPANHEQLDGVS